VALAIVVAAAVPASASVLIKGKVAGGKKFVVTAVSPAGQGVSVRTGRGGKFKLGFHGSTARDASLSLIRASGRYFGPIVLSRKGKRAYVRLSGRSLDLGRVKVKRGYAVIAKRLPRRAIDWRQPVQADAHGRPLGAGRLGVVRSTVEKRARLGVSRDTQGEDPDADGIPNAFDADDDGDLVLDNVDRDNSGESGGVFSTLFARLEQSLNAHVGGVSRAAIDSILRSSLNVIFFFDDQQLRGRSITGANVDCFALPYCGRGIGSAEISGTSESGPDLPRGRPWIEYDPDRDGLPNLESSRSNDGRPVHDMSILPHATTSQITPGDAYEVIFSTSGGTVMLPRILPPYFVTTPAIVGYDAGSGPQSLSYPVAAGAPGTDANPIAMSSERLALTFYRPQRLAIAGAEPGSFVDTGHLHYGIPLQADNREIACAGDYSNLSPTLSASAASSGDFAVQLFPLTDSADDQPPGSAGTLSFTIDLGSCFRRAGVDPAGRTLRVALTAAGESRPGGVDRAAQLLSVRMP
jgi:hypothetical protein